jgi:maltose alpha-D-glucosyltransferase/alpha-amylase
VPAGTPLELATKNPPELAVELMSLYLDDVRLLGRRTAELHRALASFAADEDFTPEPFTDFYRRGQYQAMASLVNQTLPLLRSRMGSLPEQAREDARRVLELEAAIRKCFQRVRERRVNAMRIRCHGDYHLRQVLRTGRDFMIIDFEGEVARPLGVRRLKTSPLRDVAGMVRSFHYAAYAALFGQAAGLRPEDFRKLDSWARYWHRWVSAVYLRAYLDAAAGAAFLPVERVETAILFDAFLLEKAVYELGRELANRPQWIRIPLQGIMQLVEAPA